jgi:hypothetical protein
MVMDSRLRLLSGVVIKGVWEVRIMEQTHVGIRELKMHLSAYLRRVEAGEPVAMATFDLRLWEAAKECGLIPFPDNLPAVLAN